MAKKLRDRFGGGEFERPHPFTHVIPHSIDEVNVNGCTFGQDWMRWVEEHLVNNLCAVETMNERSEEIKNRMDQVHIELVELKTTFRQDYTENHMTRTKLEETINRQEENIRQQFKDETQFKVDVQQQIKDAKPTWQQSLGHGAIAALPVTVLAAIVSLIFTAMTGSLQREVTATTASLRMLVEHVLTEAASGNIDHAAARDILKKFRTGK